MICDWVPLVRVGVFEFGKPIDEYVDKAALVPVLDAEDKTGWETFAFEEKTLRIHVENGRVISIACYEECILGATNLIGLDFDVFQQHLGAEPSEEPDVVYIDDEPQQVFEFEGVEAQVWVKDGRVVTVFCSCH